MKHTICSEFEDLKDDAKYALFLRLLQVVGLASPPKCYEEPLSGVD